MTTAQVSNKPSFRVDVPLVLILTCILGLTITWPTSYEALVGRAELKAGG